MLHIFLVRIDSSFTHISSQAPLPESVRLSELFQELIPGPLASTRSPLKRTSEPGRSALQSEAIAEVDGMI